jgi:glycosyltransferase involved in cell wall biosynthesis
MNGSKNQVERLRVCYFGTYRAEYSRNQIMIEGLRRAGVELIECHEPLWQDEGDRVQAASGGWKNPGLWLRFVRVYLRLLRRYQELPDFDVLVAGYPGQVDVFIARLLAWKRRKPLAWDIFMSIYLISLERGLDRRSPLGIGLLRWLERLACRLPDRLILDTSQYVEWFKNMHGVRTERFRLVPTGADDRIYRPLPHPPARDGLFRVLYFGTFIPNHSVETIVQAAGLLKEDQTIHFEMVGQGPEREKAIKLAESLGLANISFVDWLEPGVLVERAARAEICLGAFGETPQSLMTVQNKIYASIAMRKPLISGDSPAVREALTHGENIYLCQRLNPQALAEAVAVLRDSSELRVKLAENGYRRFKEAFDLEHIGACCAGHLTDLVLQKKAKKP